MRNKKNYVKLDGSFNLDAIILAKKMSENIF